MENYEIIDKINNGEYQAKKEYPKIREYRPDRVIDENETVRWNREEIEKRNNERMKILEEYRISLNEGELRFKDDVALHLECLYDGSLNKAQADEIVKRAWTEAHSEGFLSVLDTADELAEFVIEIIDLS